MKIYNTTTKTIEEITYLFNGIDCLGDLHGNSSHGNTYSDEHECYEMSQDDVDWWTEYCTTNEKADEMLEEAKKELSWEKFEELRELTHDSVGEMEGSGEARIAIIKEFCLDSLNLKRG